MNIFKSKPTLCPKCDGKRTISFNWGMVRNGKHKDYAKYQKGIQKKKKLKFGTLYKCAGCSQEWYLSEDSQMMSIITEDAVDDLQYWNSNDLRISEMLRCELKEIGAVPADIYGNGRGSISIPCVVNTKKEGRVDLSMVILQSTPPLGHFRKNTRFIDEIESIEASDFTLPRDIRLASTRSEEVRMGFAPLKVESRDGEKFLLNWTTDFFSHGPLKGKDITSFGGSLRLGDGMPPVVSIDNDKITCFYGDMTGDDLEIVMK